ncbi:hypothetical protein Y032_0039g53 [Ancylostoma ceylanicum]|uniref:Uncharacterized protein n=1 Tax=Ancylostoma ceylanicum TaxID=53326 RepID=A0A016UJ39_9BILA|nr:hypothetical protein Y032_0039g53 [Ancylostoma ceylanicum]
MLLFGFCILQKYYTSHGIHRHCPDSYSFRSPSTMVSGAPHPTNGKNGCSFISTVSRLRAYQLAEPHPAGEKLEVWTEFSDGF